MPKSPPTASPWRGPASTLCGAQIGCSLLHGDAGGDGVRQHVIHWLAVGNQPVSIEVGSEILPLGISRFVGFPLLVQAHSRNAGGSGGILRHGGTIQGWRVQVGAFPIHPNRWLGVPGVLAGIRLIKVVSRNVLVVAQVLDAGSQAD